MKLRNRRYSTRVYNCQWISEPKHCKCSNLCRKRMRRWYTHSEREECWMRVSMALSIVHWTGYTQTLHTMYIWKCGMEWTHEHWALSCTRPKPNSPKMKCECVAASIYRKKKKDDGTAAKKNNLLLNFGRAFFESLFCYIIIIMCFQLRISNRVHFFYFLVTLYLSSAATATSKSSFACINWADFSIYRICDQN